MMVALGFGLLGRRWGNTFGNSCGHKYCKHRNKLVWWPLVPHSKRNIFWFAPPHNATPPSLVSALFSQHSPLKGCRGGVPRPCKPMHLRAPAAKPPFCVARDAFSRSAKVMLAPLGGCAPPACDKRINETVRVPEFFWLVGSGQGD